LPLAEFHPESVPCEAISFKILAAHNFFRRLHPHFVLSMSHEIFSRQANSRLNSLRIQHPRYQATPLIAAFHYGNPECGIAQLAARHTNAEMQGHPRLPRAPFFKNMQRLISDDHFSHRIAVLILKHFFLF
jgi:hypothetical protein